MSTSCLVLGAGGQVGQALQEAAHAFEPSISFLEKQDLDITQCDNVSATIQSLEPGVIINAAAYTDVDGAETEKIKAFAVNRDGAGNVAQACQKLNIPLLHISTDFVFDGVKVDTYSEGDSVAPLSIYGQSKWEGECAIRECLKCHIILRTSWIFSSHGRNFVKSIIKLARQDNELQIVDDQIGGPTAASDLAGVLLLLAQRVLQNDALWGTYHFSGASRVSRYEFAKAIIKQGGDAPGLTGRVTPIATEDYPTPARRPPHAVLDCSLILDAFGVEQPDWRFGLKNVCRSLK